MQVLHRRDPALNLNRFYRVAQQADLFEGWSLIREWGRAGSPGRVVAEVFGPIEWAAAAAEQLLHLKARRGYR